MGLNPSEQEALAQALLAAFPSRAALDTMVTLEFGMNLDEMVYPGADMAVTVQELVRWADQTGKTAALVRGSQLWNQQSSAVSDWMGSLPRPTRRDAQTVPASSPRISGSLRQAFVDALLLIPGIDDWDFRSKLLIGIPGQASLPRGWTDTEADLETIIDQLGSLAALSSGTWPLLILADNARAIAEGTVAEIPLAKVYKRLLTFYSTK
jgi:hypothetical protein